MVAYLRHCIQQHDFSASKIQNRTQSKSKIVEDTKCPMQSDVFSGFYSKIV